MLFLFFSLFLSFLRNVPSGLPDGTFRFCETGWRKSCPAGGFGGKKSVKGNRQGFLSRSITRRSGKIAKQYYKKFCNFEGSLAKDPKGLFDKLTVRLAGRYISFMRLDVEKVALVIARPCRGRGNLAGSLRIFGKLRRIRNILCEISTSLRPPAMTRLGHLTSREPSGSLRLSKSLRFAESCRRHIETTCCKASACML